MPLPKKFSLPPLDVPSVQCTSPTEHQSTVGMKTRTIGISSNTTTGSGTHLSSDEHSAFNSSSRRSFHELITDVQQSDLENRGVPLSELDQVGDPIGSGVSGFVTRVRHRASGIEYALKYVPCGDAVKSAELEEELHALEATKNCPYFPHYHGAYVEDGYVMLLLELFDSGSLYDFIVRRGLRVPEKVLASMANQLLHALDYMHAEMNRVHRDIKPSNILLNSNGAVRIIDFGISARLKSDRSSLTSFIGTPAYMSPERLMGKGYTENADVWGLGVTLYELAVGTNPYARHATQIDMMLALVEQKQTPHLPADAGFSPQFADFIELCTRWNREERPTAIQLLQHDFVRFADDPACVKAWVTELGPLYSTSQETKNAALNSTLTSA